MSNRFTPAMPPAMLPFVGKTKTSKQLSFWTVPEIGNYSEGTKIGTAMATAYMAYLLDDQGLPPILPQIVIDMTAPTNPSDALHGQLVGFFTAIEHALRRHPQQSASQPSI